MNAKWKENNLLEKIYENKDDSLNLRELEGVPCLIQTKNNSERSLIGTYAPNIKEFITSMLNEVYNNTKSPVYIGREVDWSPYKRIEDLFRNLQIPKGYIPGCIKGKKFRAVYTITQLNNGFYYFDNSSANIDFLYHRYDRDFESGNPDQYRFMGEEVRDHLPFRHCYDLNAVGNWHWEKYPLEDQRDFLLIFHYMGIIKRNYYLEKWYEKLFGITNFEDIPQWHIIPKDPDKAKKTPPPFSEKVFKEKLIHLLKLEANFQAEHYKDAFDFLKTKAVECSGSATIYNFDQCKEHILNNDTLGWNWKEDLSDISDLYKNPNNYIVPQSTFKNMAITCNLTFDLPLNKVNLDEIIPLNKDSVKLNRYYNAIIRAIN